jgi:hypothetical protein
VLGDMKSANADDLKKVSALLAKVFDSSVSCVVGSREHIEASKDSFDHIIEI